MKFYESRAVADAGAEAIAQGNEIAFAPGKANFSTRSGQERLGHELSHVMSQRSGQVRGSGFLNNAALEARADREGVMAAAGQRVYAGPVTHALSGAVPSPMEAGSMQAKKDNEPPPQMAPMEDIQAPAMPRFPTREEIAAMKRKLQAKPLPDLVGPQISAADMNALRDIRPRNIMNEPIRQPKGSSGVGLTKYPFDDRMLKNRNSAGPESEQTDPKVRARVDEMFRIAAGKLAYENEKAFHQDEKAPKLKQKYMAQGMDEDDAHFKARREAGKEIKEKNYYTSGEDDGYSQSMEIGTAAEYNEIARRVTEEKRKLLAYRRQLEADNPGESKDALDMHAHYSDHGLKYEIMNNVLENFAMSNRRGLDFRDLILKNRAKVSPEEQKELAVMDEVLGTPGNAGEYLNTELGKKRNQSYRKRSKKYLTDLYKGKAS